MRRQIDPTTYRLLRDVSAGIRVLQSRDGVALTESQILERASNIVMGLVGNYRIETVEPTGPMGQMGQMGMDGARADDDDDESGASFGASASP